MNPISIDSTLPIVPVMGGWVEKWYMKAICRLEVDSVSRERREMAVRAWKKVEIGVNETCTQDTPE